ncbi:unannotated protein [freshwater metagenome]|uniref:Unannotated protein n=1 Tax=freshwater metagenome TaxID=449393 RepID=A0A6J6UHG7_9ZZZZ
MRKIRPTPEGPNTFTMPVTVSAAAVPKNFTPSPTPSTGLRWIVPVCDAGRTPRYPCEAHPSRVPSRAVSVSSSPLRSTTIGTDLFGLERTMSPTCPYDPFGSTATPSIDVTTSPLCRPAAIAGLDGSPSSAATSTTGNELISVGSSNTENATQKPTRASNRFIAGPAKIINALREDEAARKVLGSSASGKSVSRFVIPGVFTYAPSGIALRPYSTSPLR